MQIPCGTARAMHTNDVGDFDGCRHRATAPLDRWPSSQHPGGHLSGTLEDKLRAAAAAGFGGVELLEYDLVMSSWSLARVADEFADRGLSIEVYQPLHVEAVPAALFDARLRHAERKLDLLTDLGAQVLVCCSARSDDGVDDDRAAEQLSRVADLAAQRGLRLAYEGLPWGRIRTHEHAWRIVQRADHPALGMCLDSFHVLSSGNDPAELSSIAIEKVFHVQLAAELCELARPLGLTLDLEFPSWTDTPNLTEAVRVLRAADQPNAGLLIDVLHFARSESSIDGRNHTEPFRD